MIYNISLIAHAAITFPKTFLGILNSKIPKPINEIGIVFYGLVMPTAPA
jgi:hypothetical protein